MRVLVTAATRHGATLEIAEAIGEVLSEHGLDVTTVPVDEVPSIAAFDAAVIGSAVYYGHWLESARDLVDAHASELSDRPVWLFSSGPLGEPGRELPADDTIDVSAQIAVARPLEHRIFTGRLDPKQLGFRERTMVAALRAPEGDFRDWPAIRAFAGSIAGHLERLPQPS